MQEKLEKKNKFLQRKFFQGPKIIHFKNHFNNKETVLSPISAIKVQKTKKQRKPGVLHRYQWDLIQRNDSAGKCGANLATMNNPLWLQPPLKHPSVMLILPGAPARSFFRGQILCPLFPLPFSRSTHCLGKSSKSLILRHLNFLARNVLKTYLTAGR